MNDQLGDKFTIEREIARGGAARVFLARDEHGKTVALKVLNPQLAVTVTGKRFLREVEFLRRIDHANICRILGYGETDLLLYYVMNHVDGPTLRQHLAKSRRVSASDTQKIGADLLDALQYAHGEGIVHRDVKPENIVLSQTGPVLVDFGIARAVAVAGIDKLTRSGFVVGTSTYMSPEQIEGVSDIDHRSDLYSLGCVLFECLAGRPLFDGARDQIILRMHLEDEAPSILDVRPETPAGLAKAITKAVVRSRDERWSTAAEMREAVMAE
ncbi:MAG: serine/threonine-protein kinase [Gemmatimonadetes bacterium]|nr:serine/threonine-protein kinase [Gemmatimonadota bacterium]